MTTMAEHTPGAPSGGDAILLGQLSREDLKRALVEAVVAHQVTEAELKQVWGEIDNRSDITVAEFSRPLQDDPRIPWVHETTWGRRRNRALGRSDWRSEDPSVRRRRSRRQTET